jgi:imidazolonepropionase-like amidohydrolase
MMTEKTLTLAPIVIDHVTVIDGTDAPPRPETAVVVEGDRIEAMGPSAELARPSNAQVVEATGKYMIPGLWDMHLHTFMAQDMVDTMFPVLVAHGVVGVRDTHGDFEIATSARR